MDLESTNLVDGADTSELDTGNVDTGVAAEDQQHEPEQSFDDDGNPIDSEPDEDEEVELEPDLKLKVPKSAAQKVKDALLRQADYTRKTQALAEQSRTFEAQRQQFLSMDSDEFRARADLVGFDQKLANYQNINWQGELNRVQSNINAARANFDDDSVARFENEKANITAAHMDFIQTDRDRTNLFNALAHYRNQRAFQGQQETARALEAGRAELVKHVPEWNDTHKANLVKFAAGYGVTAQELSDIEASPGAARILHDAFEGVKLKANAKKAAALAAGNDIQPITTVRGTGSTPVRGSTRDFAAFERLANGKK